MLQNLEALTFNLSFIVSMIGEVVKPIGINIDFLADDKKSAISIQLNRENFEKLFGSMDGVRICERGAYEHSLQKEIDIGPAKFFALYKDDEV